jgi:hypothetical protein
MEKSAIALIYTFAVDWASLFQIEQRHVTQSGNLEDTVLSNYVYEG